MQTSVVKNSRLKVRAKTDDTHIFEIKTSDGLSLGFVMNGTASGATLVVAGTGPNVRSVFQQVLLWPATRSLKNRLALILLDRIDGPEASAAISDVSALLRPIKDTLFLPGTDSSAAEAKLTDLETIEAFCIRNSALTEQAARPDCASL